MAAHVHHTVLDGFGPRPPIWPFIALALGITVLTVTALL